MVSREVPRTIDSTSMADCYAPWFPIALRMVFRSPVILPKRNRLVQLANSMDLHPLHKKLTMVVFFFIRKCLRQRNISSETEEIIINSWRKSTRKSYETYLSRWEMFCCRRKLDPFSPSLNSVLDFLNELYKKGLSYYSINTASSAISALASVLGIHDSLGSSPLIKRFLKGVFECRPPTPKYEKFWDVSKVLDLLKNWKENKDLNLKVKRCYSRFNFYVLDYCQ